MSDINAQMDQYHKISYRFARELTLAYSSSFGIGSRFLARPIRPHIYAIYGLVRIADEIVDTYQGTKADALLDELEQDTYRAIEHGYSANVIVDAFAQTAREFDFEQADIKAFFASMRMDETALAFSASLYLTYIHGSAEAVGLLCLKVFTGHDRELYAQLKPGAMALGAAYQKVNFLRDMASDHRERGRMYFPGHSFENFDAQAKEAVVHDITTDFILARDAIDRLPSNARTAVTLTYVLYSDLLAKLSAASIMQIKSDRIRISTPRKLWLIIRTLITGNTSSERNG